MNSNVTDMQHSREIPEGVLTWHTTFASPGEIVENELLSSTEKREVLADWASDARACADDLTVRKHDSGAVASLNDILEALRAIDRQQSPPTPRRLSSLLPRRSKLLMGEYIRVKRRRPRDDDDDPPPVPARARPPRPPIDGADAIRPPEALAA